MPCALRPLISGNVFIVPSPVNGSLTLCKTQVNVISPVVSWHLLSLRRGPPHLRRRSQWVRGRSPGSWRQWVFFPEAVQFHHDVSGAGLFVFTRPILRVHAQPGSSCLASILENLSCDLFKHCSFLIAHSLLLELASDRRWRFSVSCLWLVTAFSHFYLFCFLYYVWMSFSILSSNSLISL